MPWEELGPSGFRPSGEVPEHFFVPVSYLTRALRTFNVTLSVHGAATVPIVDDRPTEPVLLPPPVRGFHGVPTIRKLLRTIPMVDEVELWKEMKRLIAADQVEVSVSSVSAASSTGREASSGG